MNSSLRSFAAIFAGCAISTLVFTALKDRTVANFTSIGSYVGAGVMLIGCWRLMNTSDVVQSLHMDQRVENFHAEMAGRPPPHRDMVQMFLSSGPLAFAGLLWLVLLQGSRYVFQLG